MAGGTILDVFRVMTAFSDFTGIDVYFPRHAPKALSQRVHLSGEGKFEGTG